MLPGCNSCLIGKHNVIIIIIIIIFIIVIIVIISIKYNIDLI